MKKNAKATQIFPLKIEVFDFLENSKIFLPIL